MKGSIRRNLAEDEDVQRISVALAGNPNVGKSTLFNTLTGMHRHTGNWAGKTVSTAVSHIRFKDRVYSIADIPGTYSLLSHSKEEEIARNYICFGGADITVVVCDATALERGLTLLLQIGEVTDKVILCINLIDEAERLGIKIDTAALSRRLGIPVITTVARRRSSARSLMLAIDALVDKGRDSCFFACPQYPDKISYAAYMVEREIKRHHPGLDYALWVAMRLIEGDGGLCEDVRVHLGIDPSDTRIFDAVSDAREYLFDAGIDLESYKDVVVSTLVGEAQIIAESVTTFGKEAARARDIRLDKIMTGRVCAFPVMLLLLGLVFWLTLSVASYPSALLSSFFYFIEERLVLFCHKIYLPSFICDALILGIYRTLSQVVAVMLPPMAIFFPLFALLEDSGYLPRIAYNLDRPFACSGACGKQALTMCMGIGCNAVGISGARIIDSRRERLLAILTNNFMPCNGRLPMLITVISIAFISAFGRANPLPVALVLVFLLTVAVIMTFAVTKLLSVTLLAGERSSFTIELPPYRKPEILKVVLRSLRDKALKVLLRAVVVAAPMGLLIYILSNTYIGGVSLVGLVAGALDPIGRIMGLDGVILLAFILGIPANEIVVPIMIMIYTASGSVGTEIGLSYIADLLLCNGWGASTAICTALFAIFHWPCSTSLITVYKETGSIKYTLLALLIPTAVGFILCTITNFVCGVIA